MSASFAAVDFEGAKLHGTVGMGLKAATLEGVTPCRLRGVSFDDSVLQDADFSNSDLEGLVSRHPAPGRQLLEYPRERR